MIKYDIYIYILTSITVVTKPFGSCPLKINQLLFVNPHHRLYKVCSVDSTLELWAVGKCKSDFIFLRIDHLRDFQKPEDVNYPIHRKDCKNGRKKRMYFCNVIILLVILWPFIFILGTFSKNTTLRLHIPCFLQQSKTQRCLIYNNIKQKTLKCSHLISWNQRMLYLINAPTITSKCVSEWFAINCSTFTWE